MSTNNMSDEELDKMFRDSAENYDPTYDPEAWIAMEEKLDKVQNARPWWYKLLYPLLLVLLISSTVAVVKLTNEPYYSPTNEKKEQTIKDDEHILFRRIQKQPSDNGKIRDQATGFNAENKIAYKTIAENRSKINRPSSLPAQDEYSASESIQVFGLSGEAPIQQNAPPPRKNEQEKSIVINSEQYDKASITVGSITNIEQDSISKVPEVREDAEQVADSKQVFLSSLQLMAVVAPDITTVKFNDPEAISANAGVLVSIPLAKKFSVVTGVIWANKVYGANPENYKPSPDFWNGKKMPTSIDAACQVLDIPLNLKYQLFENGQNAVALQAGLSSYIMLKEKYTYNYTYGYAPYSKTTNISNQNRHWFGVQNLSVNYSRKLTPAISVGVEPFIKFPLSGIGAGHVKLTSAGVFLTAGYTVQLKK